MPSIRSARVWVGALIASSAGAQELPPLPGEAAPSASIKVDGLETGPAPKLTAPRGKGGDQVETGRLRPLGSDFERFWLLGPSLLPSPFPSGRLAPDFKSMPAPSPFPPGTPQTTPVASPAPAVVSVPPEADPVAVRADAEDQLTKLPRDDARDATPTTKALRAVLEERLKRLKEWDKVVKDRHDAENPEPSPEKLAAEWKADKERVEAMLNQATREPDSLLPVSFRRSPEQVPDSLRAEWKEAIDSAQSDLKKWSGEFEQFRSDPSSKAGGATAEVRARRDQSQQQLTGLKARDLERQAALAEIKNPEERALARETLVNGQWETRVEAERLRGLESLLGLETRKSENAPLNLQRLEAHTKLAQQSLDRMRQRYQTMAEHQERDLRQAAAREEARAATADDPLERYRARRAADLLELKARFEANKSALAINLSPSEDEQRALADRAEADFVDIKKLLDDGKVSHLDALRFNNDFRRLGAERARIVSRELAASVDRLTKAENALSVVELELVYDSRDDRFELDNLLERVPKALHPKAEQMFRDFEISHMKLLADRKRALENLAQRAERTHQQVLRRLRILDDHFGFIRTHMFWVRDEEPVGAVTLAQARRELRQLGRAAVRLGGEVSDPSAWGRLSVEFLVASFGLIVLPWPLRKAQLVLRANSL